MMRPVSLILIAAAGLLAACGGTRMNLNEMTAARPVDLQTTSVQNQPGQEYRIGAGDEISVRVFQVADLSFDKLTVDSSGDIQMPLIGAVRAASQTAGELSADIAGRLGRQYLRNPQVTVAVTKAASQKVTIDGAVTKPGVYEMRGTTSLLQAVAMAEGPTAVADLTKVAVFRTIDGQRQVALFDLAAIRQGRAEDPAVRGDDLIVVDTSRLSSNLSRLVLALPALAIFRPF